MPALIMLLALTAAARAAERPPHPIPSAAGICPSGYSASQGFCVPHPNETRQAIPKPSPLSPCPSGTHESMGSFCVQAKR